MAKKKIAIKILDCEMRSNFDGHIFKGPLREYSKGMLWHWQDDRMQIVRMFYLCIPNV